MKTRAELEQENAKIQGELSQIRQQLLEKESALEQQEVVIDQKNVTIGQKDAFIDQLKEALILARNRKFAATTESLRSLQSEIFNESEDSADAFEAASDSSLQDIDTIVVHTHQRKRGGRKPLPEELPRIEVIHDLTDDEKVCPHGHGLKHIGDKVSEQLDVIPMQIQVIQHRRKQYTCPCCEGYLKTASKPKQPIEKSQASAGLLAYIAVSKYADSLPLYRQSTILSRFGIEMDRTTLANWMIRCGQLVQPLINRIEERLHTAPYLHVDETTVQVLNEAGKPAQSTSYMWVRSGTPPGGAPSDTGPLGRRLILFDYDPSRSGTVPQRLLADYDGAIMVDGYGGYDAVCREQRIVRLGCWAHARRKFVEASKIAKKKKNTRADYALKQIARLYQLEKQIGNDAPSEIGSGAIADYRYQQRQEKALPILEKLKAWLDQAQTEVAPKTALGKALYYLQHQWPRLIRYLDDGRYPIDNNPVENAIRPFAVGRKNWLFSTSVRGAKASANLYSLIETAKASGVEPYAYLKHVFAALPNITDYDGVDRLLPDIVND
ncbi:MAG: IS66 family transposase [Arenicellales bacterium]